MDFPAQLDLSFSSSAPEPQFTDSSIACAVQHHHTERPQVVIKITHVKETCCGALPRVRSLPEWKHSSVWQYQTRRFFCSMRLNDSKHISTTASLLRRKLGKQGCDRSHRRTRSEGTTRARRIASQSSPCLTSERSRFFSLHIFLWFPVASLQKADLMKTQEGLFFVTMRLIRVEHKSSRSCRKNNSF